MIQGQGVAIARNTIIQSIGKAVSIGLGWLILLLMTNYLGAAGFGTYTIMAAYLQLFGVTADLGMVLVSSQLLAEYVGDEDRVFANLFSFRLVTALAIFIAAPVIIWLFPYSNTVKEGVVILTASYFLIALLQVFTGLFQKVLTMGRAVAGELMGRLTLLLVLSLAVWYGLSLTYILIGIVLGSVVNLSLVAILSRGLIRIRFAYDRDLWRKIWQRSWPIAIGIIFNLVYLKADTLILSFWRGEAEVGVYGAMFRVLEVLITFPTMLAGLLLPVMATAWLRNDMVRLRQTVQQAVDALLYLAVPLVVGVVMVAPQLAALFGEEFFIIGPTVLRLLVVATAFIFIGTILGHVVVAVHRQKSMLWVYALGAIFSLAGYLIVIPPYGAYGAAAMTVAVELLVAVLIYFYLWRYVAIRPSFMKIGYALLASLPMAAFIWLSSSLPFIAIVLAAMIIYFAALYLLGALPREFLSQLYRRDTL